MILIVKTDSMQALLELADAQGVSLATDSWEAGRTLSRDLLARMQQLLAAQDVAWSDISGIVVFRGPGSFTSLRIGITTVNAIAYAQHIPLVGVIGDTWRQDGIDRLVSGEDDRIVLPEYGGEPHVTPPRK